MRFQTSLGVTALVSALLASPVYAENCSISYYCYRSMTPGPAPVEPVATSRPNPNGTRPNNLQQPRPVNNPTLRLGTQARTTPANQTVDQRLAAQQRAQTLADQRRLATTSSSTVPAPSRTASSTVAERLAAQQRAQTLADQQRLAAQRNSGNDRVIPSQTRPAPPMTTVFHPIETQSCGTLALKIKVLESQATGYARSQQATKAQSLFKTAEALR
ncbi:MAG TPA: hypothetical protein PLM98_15030, partial [Thiolinea sp.]|nr:hypothetical protein [Thiolinea sp.]